MIEVHRRAPAHRPISPLTLGQLELKIDAEHQRSGMSIEEMAVHICPVDLSYVYTGIPMWTALSADRTSKATTRISLMNTMTQAQAASGRFGHKMSLREKKEADANAGSPANSNAITIAQNGAVLIERAKRAVEQGAVGRMDLALNPAAHVFKIEVATRFG